MTNTTDFPQEGEGGTPPQYSLFDSNALGIATFLGSLLCGTLLAVINVYRMGQKGRALKVGLVGFNIFVGLFYVYYLLPDDLSWAVSGINIGVALVVKSAADRFFGSDYQRHIAAGGRVGLRGVAFLISLVFLAGFWALFFYSSSLSTGTCLENQGSEEMVCYKEPYSEADAQCLVNQLIELEYFDGEGAAHVSLHAGDSGQAVISLTVVPSAWKSSEMVPIYQGLREVLQEGCLADRELDLELVDENQEVKKTFSK
jgi:hypothetical protein